MRVARIALILAIALPIMAAVGFGFHYYLYSRLIVSPGLSPGITASLTRILILLGCSLPGVFLGERLLKPPISRVLIWPGAVWMGTAWILVVLTAFSDVVGLVVPAGEGFARWRAATVVLVAIPVTVWALYEGLRMPRIERVRVALDQWPKALDGFRIVQISDLHIGPIRAAGFVAALTRKVNAQDPDLVAVTGDLVDGSVAGIGPDVLPFKDLAAPHGVYFITGNHDIYSGPRRWMEHVKTLGWTVLANAHVVLEPREGGRFTLAGVHDTQGFTVGLPEDLDEALAGSPDELPVVLLAHDPLAFHGAKKAGVDLQLSGHTHAGQIWPFNYLVRIPYRWTAGLYREGESVIYVSRGTGFWGPPMRLLAPAEITVLEIFSS